MILLKTSMSTEGLSAAHDSTVQPLKPEQRFSTFQPLMKMIIAFFQTSHRLPTGSFSRFSPFTLPYVVNVTRNTLSSLILKLLCLDASCAFKVVIVALASLLFPNRHHFLSDLCGCVNLAMISTILSSKSCKKSKSKSGSKLQSAASTPGQDGHNVNFTPEELSKKLSDLKQKQQEPYVDRSKSNVCEKFVDGKCPHGISGKKFSMEVLASNPIPNGATVMQEMVLIKNTAVRKAVNVPFTIRNTVLPQLLIKPASLKTALWFTSSEPNGGNLKLNKREHTDDRTENRSTESSNRRPRVPSRLNEADSRRDSPQTDGLQDIGNFLELRSLLTSLQDNFQKEIQSLKSSIAHQESRLASLLPSLSQQVSKPFLPVHPPGHMVPMFLPTHTQQAHPLQQATNWSQFPVSGC